MRNTVFLIVLITSFCLCRGQSSVRSELLRSVRSDKVESSRVESGLHLLSTYWLDDPDSIYNMGTLLHTIAADKSDLSIDAVAELFFAESHSKYGRWVEVLQHTLASKKLYEKSPDTLLHAYIEYFMSSTALDTSGVTLHLQQAMAIHNIVNRDVHSILFSDKLAEHYLSIHRPDSAFLYANLAKSISDEIGDTVYNFILNSTLGSVYLQLGSNKLAKELFEKNLSISKSDAFLEELSLAYSDMGIYYDSVQKADSAVYYYTLSYQVPVKSLTIKEMNAPNIFGYYLGAENYDSTRKYLGAFVDLMLSFGQISKISSIGQLMSDEKQREKERDLLLKQREDDRLKQFKLLTISLIILGAAIAFLLLSRTIIVGPRFINTIGIVLLLVIFEFVNLILHPILDHYFHDSEWFMLLSLVVLGICITPVHHYFQKLVKTSLIAKNEEIRKKNAKRVLGIDQK